MNDLVIRLANVNGTGSASANGLLMKSIFRMGVPVVGKNFFPSNIQGLPTWYEIRVSRDGHMARRDGVDVMVAMNAQTYAEDLASVVPGGVLLYDSTWPRVGELSRDDVQVLGIPLSAMCNEAFDGVRARILMKNVAYVGALAALLDLDLEVIRRLLEETFAAKPALVESNLQAIRMGHDYATEHFVCPLPVRVMPADATAGHIMIDGNTAAALGCLYAGATVGAWYPITPSTSLMDAFRSFCARHRVDEATGQRNYCVIQAEDELAAIGMVLGASWAGARAFTATSGPGISLMSEFLGFGYFTELPAVLFNVQRVGPSTGLPTRTQQGDITSCAYASHGDTKHVLLFPKDPAECFEFAVTAFDLAERLQTPVIVMSDLDIGMNDWMCREFAWDDAHAFDRGKVLGPAELDQVEDWGRYRDVDGDGIPWRTLPGQDARGAYFTRGSGHDEYARYTENAEAYQGLMERLAAKFETAATLVPEAKVRAADGADAGLITVGSCAGAALEARERLAAEGQSLDYCRIRAFPFGPEVKAFLEAHPVCYVLEQNRDGQLKSLLVNECGIDPGGLRSVLIYDGLPITADAVARGIREWIDDEVPA